MNNNGNLLLCPTSHPQEPFILSSKRRMCENQTLPSRELEQNPVDGRNPANQLIGVVCSTIYKVLYIPGGCLGFQPSTVGMIQNPLLKVPQHFGETTSRRHVWRAPFSCYTNNNHVREYLEKKGVGAIEVDKNMWGPMFWSNISLDKLVPDFLGMHNRMQRCKTGIKKLMEFRYLSKNSGGRFPPSVQFIFHDYPMGSFRWLPGCQTSNPAGSVQNKDLEDEALDVWKMAIFHVHGTCFFSGKTKDPCMVYLGKRPLWYVLVLGQL